MARDLGSSFETLGKYLKDEAPKASPELPSRKIDSPVSKPEGFKYSEGFEKAYARLLSNPEDAVGHLSDSSYRTVGGEIHLSSKKYAELTAALKDPGPKIQQVAETGRQRVESVAVQSAKKAEVAEISFVEAVGKAWKMWREPKWKKKEKMALQEQKLGLAQNIAEYKKTIDRQAREKAKMEADLASIDSKLLAYA